MTHSSVGNRVKVKTSKQGLAIAKTAFFKPNFKYKRINEDVSAAAATNMAAHMWYLPQKLVGLAFFEILCSV